MGFFRNLAARIDRFYRRNPGDSDAGEPDAETDASSALKMSPGLIEYILQVAEYADGERIDTPKKVDRLIRRLQKIRSAVAGKEEAVLDLKNTLAWIRSVRPVDPMFSRLRDGATPELVRLLHTADDAGELADECHGNVMKILMVLAGFQTDEATREVVRAILSGIGRKSWLWSGVFEPFDAGHPFRDRFYDALREALPRVPILDDLVVASVKAAENDPAFRSPFDSPEGVALFRKWLSGDREFDYMASRAAEDLASFREHDPAELLELAARHPYFLVQADAAGTRIKRGDPDGRARLEQLAADPDPETAEYAQLLLEVRFGTPSDDDEA